ncbi:hypothetical protein BGZ93_003435 [Podila epicladia]|nr:hypothetical protein BGZ93_003435 [Podila epicladia]
MARNKRKTSVDHNHSDTTPAPDQKRRQNKAQTRPLEPKPAPHPPQPSPQPHDIKGKGKAVETHYHRADKTRARSMTPAYKAQESYYQIADKIRARSTTPSIRSNALIGKRNPRSPRRILLPQSRSGSETVPTSEDEDEPIEAVPGRRRSDGEVETSQPTMDEMMPSLFFRDTRGRSESRSRSRESRSKLQDPEQAPASNPESQQSIYKNSDPEEPPIVSCIFTGLSAKASAAFDTSTTRLVEAGLLMEHIPNQDSSDSCTHVVTSAEKTSPRHHQQHKDKGGSVVAFELCPRKLKYLFGLLSPAWIVRHEWFTDSIEQKRWLPLTVDSEYLIQGDTHFGPTPGTTARRQARHKSNQAFKRLELQRLVQRGGATVLSRRPTKASSSSSSSQTKSEHLDNTMFGPERPFLYLPDDAKPWQVAIDRHRPIVVCDPSHVPAGTEITQLSPADLKKHGWLRDFQAVSVTWLLNCVSCNLLGDKDLETLNSVSGNSYQAVKRTRSQTWELDQAWRQWHDLDTE